MHHNLTVPIPDEAIRALHVGDTVFLNGIIVLGRDAHLGKQHTVDQHACQ